MAKREIVELSPDAQERIRNAVRSLAEDRVDRGIEVGRQFRCDSCGEMKPGAGSSTYGPYKLCNDCLLDFTLKLASNQVDSVDNFMRRETDPGALSQTEWIDPVDRPVSRAPLAGRDKLMPSNDPC